jgi:hypothetical protein
MFLAIAVWLVTILLAVRGKVRDGAKAKEETILDLENRAPLASIGLDSGSDIF